MNWKSTVIGAAVAVVTFGLWVWIALSLEISGIFLLTGLLGALLGAILIGICVFQKIAVGSWPPFLMILCAILLGVIWPLVSILIGVSVSAVKMADTQRQARPQSAEETPTPSDNTHVKTSVALKGNELAFRRGKEEGKKISWSTQVARWPRKISVTLPAQNQWLVTDIDVEPGLAYPVTGSRPPGHFDFDIGPNLVPRYLEGPFPDDFLCRGAAAYLIATRPGKFTFRLVTDPHCSGTWTFEVGRGVPADQARAVMSHYEIPRYAAAP